MWKKTQKKPSIKFVQEEWGIFACAVNSLEKDGKVNNLKHYKRDTKNQKTLDNCYQELGMLHWFQMTTI